MCNLHGVCIEIPGLQTIAVLFNRQRMLKTRIAHVVANLVPKIYLLFLQQTFLYALENISHKLC